MFSLTTRRVRKLLIIHIPNGGKPHKSGDRITGTAAYNTGDVK